MYFSPTFRLHYTALLLPLVLVACRGTFDPVLISNDASNIPEAGSSEPLPPIVIAPEHAKRLGSGFTFDVIARNTAFYNESGERLGTVGQGEEAKPQEAEPHLRLDPNLKKSVEEQAFLPSVGFRYVNVGLENYQTLGLEEEAGPRNALHVRRVGDVGTLRYHVTEPTATPPEKGTFAYNGIWAFVTEAKQGVCHENQGCGNTSDAVYVPGDHYSLTSENDANVVRYKSLNQIGTDRSTRDQDDLLAKYNKAFVHANLGHFSHFSVNFDDKTLQGTLEKVKATRAQINSYTNGQPVIAPTVDYRIQGSIDGNQFTGTATAGNPNDNVLKANASKVEGGFFGPNADEMAGHFMTDDNSALVVFAGAQEEDKRPRAHLLRLNVDLNEDFVPYHKVPVVESSVELKGPPPADPYESLLPHVLNVDGHILPLIDSSSFLSSAQTGDDSNGVSVTFCCDRLEHVKFGALRSKNTAKSRKIDPSHYIYDNESSWEDGSLSEEDDKLFEVEYYGSGEAPKGTAYHTGTRSKLRPRGDKKGQPITITETSAYKDDDFIKRYQNGKYLFDPYNDSLFIQGVYSPVSQIPTSGQYDYQGTWQGVIVHNNVPRRIDPEAGVENGTRALFKVNFDDKSVNGKLYAQDDLDAHPSINIQATIEGNAFKGTANSSNYGFFVDAGASAAQGLHFSNIPTQGHFYGPNAQEMAGYIAMTSVHRDTGRRTSSDDFIYEYDKIGVVYGARATVDIPATTHTGDQGDQ